MNIPRHNGQSRGGSSIDPITFEVIRHKLEATTEEQAITLKNVSGSPVVTEATDFNVGIYLADGAIVNMGPQVIFHAGTMSTVIYSIIEHFSDNPGINEGDMFILNDPYRGAIHQPDVSIVMPIFHEGRRIAWTGSCAHELDTGGMTFGSWAFGATDVQQEAMLLPGVKIVEQGVLREDIWQMIMGMTRLPHVVGLDFKAMIAANNVAARRFHQLMERYGVETVDQVMRTEIDTSERLLRERLKLIPDGIYRARDFLDHDGHANRLYQIEVAAIKQGDTLTLDMSESSPQAPGFINCTRSGLRGALFTGILPILACDIRWNEGVLKPVAIKVPEANICNARWPTPVSGATVSTAWVAQNVAVAAISRMVAAVPELVREGQAVTKGQFSVLTMAGADRDGGPFGMLLMDAMAGGGGGPRTKSAALAQRAATRVVASGAAGRVGATPRIFDVRGRRSVTIDWGAKRSHRPHACGCGSIGPASGRGRLRPAPAVGTAEARGPGGSMVVSRLGRLPISRSLISSPLRVSNSSKPLASISISSRFAVRIALAS